ncbi:MAG: hypothetical protein JW959_13615 [Pirellulales bacterium]|nr:hypothetical protein [Pirellulales bacterium]
MRLAYVTYFAKLLHRFRRLTGVDKAVFYAVLSRTLSMAGGLIIVPLILTCLTSAEQGFYYTFYSILALQVFLELGFGAVAIQMVAHEAAHLKIDLTSGAFGTAHYLDRFSATIRFVRKWYMLLSVLIGIFLFPAGFYFFSTSAGGSSAAWLGPWTIMVCVAAVGVFVNSLGSIVEGMGFVAEAVRVRLWGSATQIIFTIAGLLAGLRLYSVPIAGACALIINYNLVRRLLYSVIRETRKYGRNTRIDWRKDVLPFQWRIALSWMSGWFIFNAMVPVAFRQLGPEEAGRFGLAISISGFISAFASNWLSTKAAIWGQMASRNEWKQMDALFWKVTPQALCIAALASAGTVFIIPHLEEWIPRFAGRVPEWRVLLMLCSATVMNQILFAEAFYLRAHKREPFLANSVFLAAAMAIGLMCFSHSSVFSIASMYAVVLFLGGLVWGNIVFFYCRFHWHRDSVLLGNAPGGLY